MSKRKKLRLISLAMFVVAVIFVFCALSNPALGRTFYVFGFEIGADIWRKFYAIYAVVMAALFAASFFVKNNNE